jgi:hypothetical protein
MRVGDGVVAEEWGVDFQDVLVGEELAQGRENLGALVEVFECGGGLPGD